MKLHAITNNYAVSFRAEQNSAKSNQPEAQKPVYDKNPIKKGGERAVALHATVVAGLGFGARFLFSIFNSGDGLRTLGELCNALFRKISGAPKPVKPTIADMMSGNLGRITQKRNILREIGGTVLVAGGIIGALALIYTAFNTPKALYKADVNTFKKQKDMDVYIRGNAVEKELYDQMNDKAKDASTAEEKAKLNEQYLKLKTAKNSVPDFVKLER